MSLGNCTNDMANQIKTVGGSGTIGLQVTKEVRDAELVEEREVETDGNREWSKEPTYRADVRVFAFDNHLLVVDLDRMNTDEIAEIVSKTASATESIYRASDSSVQTKGHGYMVALPPARDAGFSPGESAPVVALPNMMVILRKTRADTTGGSESSAKTKVSEMIRTIRMEQSR